MILNNCSKTIRVLGHALSFIIAFFFISYAFAEDLWTDHNPYSAQRGIVVGSILKLIVDEPMNIEYDFDEKHDSLTVIKLNPDKTVLPVLPPVTDDRSSQKKTGVKLKSKDKLSFRMAVRVTAIDNENIVFQGQRRIASEEGVAVREYSVSGIVSLEDVKKNKVIRSRDVSDLNLTLRGGPTISSAGITMKEKPSADPAKPAIPAAELSEEEKAKLLLDYLNKYIGETE